MVNPGLIVNLFEFQENAVINLIKASTKEKGKDTILMKAPTGAGKTIILIDFIDKYLNNVSSNTSFIWLCPGKGDLEEQSRNKMKMFCPGRKTQNLFDALLNGFESETTTFINWELVTKKGNTSIRESERKNLFDRIAEAHRQGIDFVVIIDEEHSNNTSKAKAIIDAFAARKIIRVSATVNGNKRFEFFEIDELDVIQEGLITKALYVNEGLEANISIEDDYDTLLDLADKKRIEIAERYNELGKNIRPLVLIQFPNARPETIEAVENKLYSLGYTYENGMVAKWMSEDKSDLPDNLTENNGIPVFLLMKQAISTGWDCPRAKILVKLRENMSESFEIQTIGRIRRMPEAKHYEDDLLDFCYIYTLDEKYKAGLLATVDKAYETRRLFLKEKCKTFTLEKQIRDLDFDGLGEREVLNKIYEHLVNKYKLSNDKLANATRLESAGFRLNEEIMGKVLHGKYIETVSVGKSEEYITTRKFVNTHKHGIDLLHSVDAIKSTIGMSTAKVKVILERLFKYSPNKQKKILDLSTAQFYAFIINNEHRLKEEFREVTAGMAVQQSLVLQPKTSTFRLPEQDFYKYDSGVKNEVEYLTNAYHEYTSGFATSLVRSTSELLFEKYCEKNSNIEWVYKNGDTGQQYFSIVYIDALQKQWLFYADYILKMKDGSVWVIETKGGEVRGESKNIDRQVVNKFNAFKEYAKKYNLNWGFVRDKDGELYINNTEYHEDMSDDSWREIYRLF